MLQHHHNIPFFRLKKTRIPAQR